MKDLQILHTKRKFLIESDEITPNAVYRPVSLVHHAYFNKSLAFSCGFVLVSIIFYPYIK